MRTATGDHFILAASAMESARLVLLSDLALGEGPAFHVGRHMLFHCQTNGVGIFKQRIHGERGQSVTNGIADFRGVNEGGTDLHPDGRPLGGIVEFGTSSEPIGTGKSSKQSLDVAANIPSIRDVTLKQLLVESPFHAHIAVMIMQAEDAPQATNRVDLDPNVRDVFGLPVVRLTYASHRFELDAAAFYKPQARRDHAPRRRAVRVHRPDRRPAAQPPRPRRPAHGQHAGGVGHATRTGSCTTSTTSTAWTAASCRPDRATTRR